MAIYYIGLAGAHGASDTTGTGAIDQPFETFAAVANLLVPGDIVYFREGTYQNTSYQSLTEQRNDDGSIVNDANGNPIMVRDIWKAGEDAIIKLNDTHGEQGNPITIAAEPGAAVKLQYDGNSAIGLRGSSHINIEGFEIEGPGASFASDAQARSAAGEAQWLYRITNVNNDDGFQYLQRVDVNSELVNNEIVGLAAVDQLAGFDRPSLFTSPAISLSNGSNDITVNNNVIHHSGAHAVQGRGGNDRITVTNNEIYENNHYTFAGSHAISFKGLDDAVDGGEHFITITGNYLHENYNLLISWAQSKTKVSMHVDEGKSIHIQDAHAGTGVTGWTGNTLIANNLIVNAGNSAVTANQAINLSIINNTIIDAGYVNQLIAQDIPGGSL